MPFQKGNKISPGRGTAIGEQIRLQRLWEKWTKPGAGNAIIKRMGSGKESLEDVFFALGYKENPKVLVEIFKKLHPDLVKTDITSGGQPLQITFDSAFTRAPKTNSSKPREI